MKAIVLVGLMAAAAAVTPADQDALNAAKDLYASAAYEEALSALSKVSDAGKSEPAVARQADEYRAFCLYALGRTAEAETVAEGLIRREPLVQLESADASPRLEAMFSTVRKRILPSLIRDRYRTARGFVDQKQYAEAEPRLAETRKMLTEAEKIGAMDEGLKDLGVLVDGFLTLARAQNDLAPRPAAAAAPLSTTASAPGGTTTTPASARASQQPPAASTTPAVARSQEPPKATPARAQDSPRTQSAPPAVVPPAVPASANSPAADNRVYTVEDEGIVPPVAIYQRPPSVPVELLTIVRTLKKQMIVNVLVDEAGNVKRANVIVSVNPSYDDLLVRAAASWKYRPATKAGVPVMFEKTVLIDVK